MERRDFFRYCTTLKPLELKALGELSFIQHLAPGRIIYTAGDPSGAIYVVTRGTVELSGAVEIPGVDTVQLSRGDIVGDLETLTGQPRKQTARAGSALSIQCFLREDFEEIMRRVPSFFLFLAAHLAHRLERAETAGPESNPESLELHGNLANFDLVTIYQTIVSSRQTGELRIYSENSDLISVFFFDDGAPRTGQFQHLTGEEAFTQLFLTDTLTGSFLFSSEGRVSSCIQGDVITRTAGDLLIRAIQARDELHQLKERYADTSATLLRRRLNFTWPDDADPELKTAAEHVWQLIYAAPLPASALYNRSGVCELKIYQALDVLIRSGQCELCAEPAAEKVA